MHGEADQTVPRHRRAVDTPYDAYHKIHKHLVGPATADKLVSFYESLTATQRPREMYAAGWAAAEAALVGTQYDTLKRTRLAVAARESWEYALLLEQERASESALVRGKSPDTTEQYRYASTLALAPIIEAIPRGIIPKQTLRDCHERLITVAELNAHDMQTAILTETEGRADSHMGVAFEQIAPLGINRLMSSRIVGMFSLARSGTGFHYPKQTHDMMVLNLNKSNIVRVTPTEIKATLKVKVSNRYDAALFGGKNVVGEDKRKIVETIDIFKRELTGETSQEEAAYLDTISEAVIHSMRHHHRAQQFGRHCLNMSSCMLEHPTEPLIAS
jgi:hypothetical protein